MDERLNKIDVTEAIVAQSIYTTKNILPRFAPDDGRCYECSRQIYDKITVGQAASALVTGCPWCNTSYVD